MVSVVPSSWLLDKPRVSIQFNHLCNKNACSLKIRQATTKTLKSVSARMREGDVDSSAPEDALQAMFCRVCNTLNNVKACARCKAAGYCGTEHQSKPLMTISYCY